MRKGSWQRSFVARTALGCVAAGASFGCGSSPERTAEKPAPEPIIWVRDGERPDIGGLFDGRGSFKGSSQAPGTRPVHLRIRALPVETDPGVVLAVEYGGDIKIDAQGRLLVTRRLRGPLSVVVTRPARPGEKPSAEALSIFDTMPDLCKAVRPADPTETGKALEAQGYRLRWTLVRDNNDSNPDGPTTSRAVGAPPAGTVITGVSSADHEYYNVPAGTTDLEIEIAPRGSSLGDASGEGVTGLRMDEVC
jgi:hypothetical protein